MKIKVNEKVLGYDGEPLQTPVKYGKPELRDMLVRDLIIESLNSIDQNTVLTAEKKAQIYSITTKVYNANSVDLTVNELSFIKERAGEALMPIGYGKLCDIIDPDTSKDSTTDSASSEQ